MFNRTRRKKNSRLKWMISLFNKLTPAYLEARALFVKTKWNRNQSAEGSEIMPIGIENKLKLL